LNDLIIKEDSYTFVFEVFTILRLFVFGSASPNSVYTSSIAFSTSAHFKENFRSTVTSFVFDIVITFHFSTYKAT